MRHSLVTALLVVLGISLVSAAALYAAAPTEELATIDLSSATPAADEATPAPAGPLPTPDSLGEFLGALWAAAAGGAWLALGALLVNGLMWWLRREQGWLVEQLPWLGTRGGGLFLLFLLGALAEVLARMAAPAGAVPLGFVATLVAAIAAGFNAMSKAAPALARSTWRAIGG